MIPPPTSSFDSMVYYIPSLRGNDLNLSANSWSFNPRQSFHFFRKDNISIVRRSGEEGNICTTGDLPLRFNSRTRQSTRSLDNLKHYHTESRSADFRHTRVRQTKNGTNFGHFLISFSIFWLGYWKLILKCPWFVHLVPIWQTTVPNLPSLEPIVRMSCYA